MTFGGQELYPTIEAKATSLCFSIVMNHPFADGNERVGHAAMETFLVLNGLELVAELTMLSKSYFHLPHMNCPARSAELGQIECPAADVIGF